MQDKDWIHFIADNRERLMPQLRERVPDLEFTSIMPGAFPIVYLQRPHGTIELGFLALQLDLDDDGNIREVRVVEPPDDWDEEISQRPLDTGDGDPT